MNLVLIFSILFIRISFNRINYEKENPNTTFRLFFLH